MQVATFVAYLAAAALFIYGIRRLRTPETARSGNTLAAAGMVIALIATVFIADIDGVLSVGQISIGVLVGSVIGAVAAQRVQMTAMPQMVAAFNGVGGGAAALIAVSEFYRVEALGQGQETIVASIAVLLSVVIGTVSFAGSIIAFTKLQELALTGSVTFPLQQVVNAAIFLVILLLSANILAGGIVVSPLVSLYLILGASLLLGVLFVIPIGGADMPIVTRPGSSAEAGEPPPRIEYPRRPRPAPTNTVARRAASVFLAFPASILIIIDSLSPVISMVDN